jgi:hypothetical protein
MHRGVVFWGLVASMGAVGESSASASDEVDHGGVRIGFDAHGGAGAGHGVSGPVFGMKLRLGWQFDHRVAACLQGSTFWWDSSETRNPSGTTANGAIGFHLTPIFSFTPSDLFDIAAGPSLDLLVPISESTVVSSTTSSGNDSIYGTHLGIHGRFAVLLGEGPSPESGRRTGFSIGGDIHTTLVDGGVIGFFTLGVGTEWY